MNRYQDTKIAVKIAANRDTMFFIKHFDHTQAYTAITVMADFAITDLPDPLGP